MTADGKLLEIIIETSNGVDESIATKTKNLYDVLVKDVAPHMGLGQSDIDFMITRLHKRYLK